MPKYGLLRACEAMAPAPARTKGTIQPTHGSHVETATPSSPVRGQRAVMEKVLR